VGGDPEVVESATGAKGKTLFQPIRIALTGRAHGRSSTAWCR
jgi:hypothetical protein